LDPYRLPTRIGGAARGALTTAAWPSFSWAVCSLPPSPSLVCPQKLGAFPLLDLEVSWPFLSPGALIQLFSILFASHGCSSAPAVVSYSFPALREAVPDDHRRAVAWLHVGDCDDVVGGVIWAVARLVDLLMGFQHLDSWDLWPGGVAAPTGLLTVNGC
jgi:hypothetical protein